MASLSMDAMTIAALDDDRLPIRDVGSPREPEPWAGENFPMERIPNMGEEHVERYRLAAFCLELDQEALDASSSGDLNRLRQVARDRERFGNFESDSGATREAADKMRAALDSNATDSDTRFHQDMYWASTESYFDDDRIDALLTSPYPEVRMMIAGQGNRLQEISDSDPDSHVSDYANSRLVDMDEQRYEPSR